MPALVLLCLHETEECVLWGKGYGTEALRQMTEFLFQSTDAMRLFAPVLAPNKASMKILEKYGFVLEVVHVCAVFREVEGGFLDEHLLALKGYDREMFW